MKRIILALCICLSACSLEHKIVKIECDDGFYILRTCCLELEETDTEFKCMYKPNIWVSVIKTICTRTVVKDPRLECYERAASEN